MQWIVAGIVALYVAGHVWLWIGWLRLQRQRARLVLDQQTPVSIVTCAHNEAGNLPRLYACLLRQTHSNWEWLVADDRSRDGSAAWLDGLAAQDSRVRVIHIAETPSGWAPKKWALQQAVHRADHRLILMTDADCLPPPNWAERMTAALKKADLVLGYSPYQEQPGFLNALLRFDTWWIAAQYLGAMGWGVPYMAVGRSLAVRRALWEAVQGSNRHRDVPSGDDDLLVHEAARVRARFAAVWEPDAAVVSAAPATWGQWLRQKRRHLSAAPRYPGSAQVALLLWAALQVLVVLGLPVLWLLGSGWAGVAWLSLLIFRAGSLFLLPLPNKPLTAWLPLMDVAWQAWTVWLGFSRFVLARNAHAPKSTETISRGFA